MGDLLLSAAGAAYASAAFLFVLVAFTVMLGANAARDALLRLAIGAVLLGLLGNGLHGALHAGGDPDAAGMRVGPDNGIDTLLCTAAVVGHGVLALVLLLRWLRPRAAQERADENGRARLRERVRVPPRDRDLEP